MLTSIVSARADTLDVNIRPLTAATYKVRLAAAHAPSKSHDPRAVIALGDALIKDDESTIRRVAALALAKMIDARTAEDARELGLDALAEAAITDADHKVRSTALRSQQDL